MHLQLYYSFLSYPNQEVLGDYLRQVAVLSRWLNYQQNFLLTASFSNIRICIYFLIQILYSNIEVIILVVIYTSFILGSCLIFYFYLVLIVFNSSIISIIKLQTRQGITYIIILLLNNVFIIRIISFYLKINYCNTSSCSSCPLCRYI